MNEPRTIKTLTKNDQPLEHRGPNGTEFKAKRCDLRGGVDVFRPRYVDDARYAADLAEFGCFHTYWIVPELNGFQGWGAIKFNVTIEE